jgi:effector-binding domain-containing protein
MGRKTEEPSYNVLRTLEMGVEIREYDSQIRASTQMGEENRSFGILAEFIFGFNDHEEKIGMTAPVVTHRDKMSFIMPKRYNLESLPKPLSVQIKIDQVQKSKVAVIRFSGYTSPKKMDEQAEKLLTVLKSNGIEIDGDPFLMRYNPPWTLPFLRRNEVAVKVKL